MTVQQGARVRAPEFPAGTWFNVGETGNAATPSSERPEAQFSSDPLSLRALRGKIVLLDFWTFCCANCLHVIDELRELEERFADVLVIVGVHSPKFEHEKSDAAVRAATERYGVAHPVFNDPQLQLWQQYAVRAWPTLVLVDPQGYVVAQAAGEGQVSGLAMIIEGLIAEHDAAGTLRRGDNPYREPVVVGGDFRFPASAISYEDGLLVADAGHHQIVRTDRSQKVTHRFGSGRGAPFTEPNGLAAAPDGLGFDVLVADTGSHRLLGLRLADGAITHTVDLAAKLDGTTTITGPVPSVLSPWDVVWWPAAEQFVIAAAGVHLLLGWNPVTDTVTILAGTTVEGLKDGPALDGWLAQPSGLAVDGDRVWFADSETSSLRFLTRDGQLNTAVGEGLFDFGHVDGPAKQARFQHPLGLAVLDDGSIAVADTYNGSIRRYDPATDEVSTLATNLTEPSGIVVTGGDLTVVESGAHRLVRPELAALTEAGDSLRTDRPVTEVAATVWLRVPFEPPPGRKLDDRYGPSTRLTVSASPPALLVSGAGDGTELHRDLVLAEGMTGVLSVTAQAASCDSDGTEHPACYLARQDWGVPIRVTDDGPAELTLTLLG